MVIEVLHLTEQEQIALQRISENTGKTPDELVHDAIRQLIEQSAHMDRLSLLQQARGMWKNRTDLPTSTDLRREWERHSEGSEVE